MNFFFFIVLLGILFIEGMLIYKFFSLLKEYKEDKEDKTLLFFLLSIAIIFICINMMLFHMKNHVRTMPKTLSAPYVKDIPAIEKMKSIITKKVFFDLRI